MAKTECYWYISESLHPWEAAVAGALARALIRGGSEISVFAAAGTDELNVPGILSWHSMTALERASAVLFRGRLWHLWGAPPPWWPLVRLRARTVHTGFSPETKWKGHPTVLSAAGRRGGVTCIPPALEVKVNWGGEGPPRGDGREEALVCMFAGDDDNMAEYSFPAGLGVEIRSIGSDGRQGMENLTFSRALLIIENPSPSLALLAAGWALMGVPTAAPASAFMDEMLGACGYIHLNRAAGPGAVQEALARLAGEGGRGASAAARRLASEQFAPERGAKKLESLYSSLARKKDERENEG